MEEKEDETNELKSNLRNYQKEEKEKLGNEKGKGGRNGGNMLACARSSILRVWCLRRGEETSLHRACRSTLNSFNRNR